MVRRIGSFVALLVVATLVLAACGSQDDEVEPTVTRIAVEGAPSGESPETEQAAESPAAQGEASGEPAAGAVTVDLEMVDIQFHPAELTVPANTDVTVNLVNNGVSGHTFNIDELGVDSGEYAAGQTGTVKFNSGAPGEYTFYCAVPGHKEAGMVGKLIVTASAEGSTEPEGAASPAAASPVAGATPVASPVASQAAEPAPAAAAQTTFDVEMVDIAFNPTEITVPANTEITINLVNNGLIPHTFDIDELGVNSGELASGQTATVKFNSGAPGTYTYYCAIPGHKEGGMVGTITVQ